MIGFLYQIVKDETVPQAPKELIRDRIIRNIHYNDVDKQISILNNVDINANEKDEQEENISPRHPHESPSKKDEV